MAHAEAQRPRRDGKRMTDGVATEENEGKKGLSGRLVTANTEADEGTEGWIGEVEPMMHTDPEGLAQRRKGAEGRKTEGGGLMPDDGEWREKTGDPTREEGRRRRTGGEGGRRHGRLLARGREHAGRTSACRLQSAQFRWSAERAWRGGQGVTSQGMTSSDWPLDP